MRILAIRPHRAHKPSKTAGFSLLEVLVVMALMGLIVSLVGVRLVSSIESARFAARSDAIIADFKMLRAEALMAGQAIYVVGNDVNFNDVNGIKPERIRQLNLPENWTLSGGPVTILEAGLCSGGEITLSNGQGRIARYKLTPPKCAAERIPLS